MLCPCGRPLHYKDLRVEERVAQIISRLGPTMMVTCGPRTYRVQRHYLALHGIKAAELPELARAGIIAEIQD